MMRPLRATVLAVAAVAGLAPLVLATLAVAQPAPPPAPANPPVQAVPPAPPPPPPIVPITPQSPDRSADPFGQDVTLTPKTFVFIKGNGTWDQAFDTIVGALKTVVASLDKQGLKPSGPPMTVYTSADDTGFSFQAGFPVAEAPKEPAKDAPKSDIGVGQSPGGKALKFTHRGSYDGMDNTYEAITNYLDEKKLEAQDTFVEEYRTDPLTTPDEKLVVDIYVPLK